ncbi:MAG: hypothetical protein CK532_06010 [Flavobacteriales bacterium]|nr:MAG: hypothetical protein CK543_02885 [Flavobacteriales bacterium]PHX91890.1 MAG: hypothetical protein CK532_06010 [Flavobacteriales bacterium]
MQTKAILSGCSFFLLFGCSLQGQLLHTRVADPINYSPNSFYWTPSASLFFCQIDGDQASGFNKLGFQFALTTGYRLKARNIDALELSMGIAERGSRRFFNAETLESAFHIRAKQIELQIAGLKQFGSIEALFGLRPTMLLKIQECEGVNPGIADDFARFGCLASMGMGCKLSKKVSCRLSLDYSVYSILRKNARLRLYNASGAFHNGLGVTLNYIP